MPRISRFWIDYAAGRRELSPAWNLKGPKKGAKKGAKIALKSLNFDDVPLDAWMQIGVVEQKRLLREAVPVEA